MNPSRASLNHPYTVIALVLLVAAMGIIGFMRTPVDLFPNTNPPQVVVITQQPGASAGDIEDKITQIIEKEVNTVSGVESIRSTSRDQVSSITVEFKYTKDPGQAIVDVQNAIARIQSDLPERAQSPSIYELNESTSRPLLTLALSPGEGSVKSLRDIRLLAENQIKDRILRLDGVADVDVFGGNKPEVVVGVSRDKLAANDISLGEVIGVLAKQNISVPAGTLYSSDSEYLIRTAGEFKDLQDIRNLPLLRRGEGQLLLSDLAEVRLAEQEPRSLYHGNKKESIALGIIKPQDGPTVETIERVKSFLPELKAEYPKLDFDITQDQQPLIDINMQGMVSSITQAVILTILVIFLFLADTRAALTAGLSLPLSFLFTLSILWLSPYTLNMITLTGLIVATGLVVDSSVVVLENIYRHFRGPDSPTALEASSSGTRQIALPNTAGTLTTVAVLLPIIFIGGYAQRTIGRLSLTISTTLLASLLISLTLVPLLTSRLLSKKRKKGNLIERWAAYVDVAVEYIRLFYLFILKKALNWRVLTLVLVVVFFLLSVRTIPSLVGGELMPPMDTGISIVEFNLPATDSLQQVEDTLQKVEKMIYAQPGVKTVSSVAGSEPGALSFGTGGTIAQSASITVHLVDRTERADTIWEIQEKWRKKLRKIPGIKSYRVSEYGATPMATTKAPLNIIISGPDPKVLDKLADRSLQKLQGVPGLVDVRKSWYFDEKEYDITVDPALARLYGTSPEEVSGELMAALQGIPATRMRLENYLDIPLRVEYLQTDVNSIADLKNIYVGSDFGPVPLRSLANIDADREQPFVTREELQSTIDVTGVNRDMSISQVTAKAKKRIDQIAAPGGYSIEFSGTTADMMDTQKRLRRSLIIGIVFLYLLLLAMFRSFMHPLTIMAAIPLAVAGSLWGLLIFDKPMSMPGNMGMIFLAGIIINNSILLLDFIIETRKQGVEKAEAIKKAVELRVRPILMTTFSTVVGLSPLAFEMAVGLERLSPLAIVAGTGLLIGTFLTMIVVPVVYSSLDSLKQGFTNLLWKGGLNRAEG
ncbi:MAG: efflux RND transporter permease subunit [Desulfobacterales bacterium]